MFLGLGVLLVVLGLLSVGGISGLSKYRALVKDLELSLQSAPRNSDLVAAIGLIIKPLSEEYFIREQGPEFQELAFLKQRDEFQQTLAEVWSLVEGHYRQLDIYYRELAEQTPQRERFWRQREQQHLVRKTIDTALIGIEQNIPRLAQISQHDDAVRYMLQSVADLLETLERVPDPSSNMLVRLEAARSEYRWYLSVVWVTSLLAISLFLGLAWSGYRWVVTPIRALHRGACRVAAGDFDYRLEVRTNDEISSLARAFNQMTDRFQVVTQELDRQVHQQTRQLVQSAKLAGVGFLAAGVAHEINNPLHAISTAAEGLEYRLDEMLRRSPVADAAIIREYLRMMQTESSRCRGITEKLLDFARGRDAERNFYDVTAIIREVLSMVQHVGKYRDRTIAFDTIDPLYAHISGSEIKQVVLNIVANALEATTAGGALTITTRETLDAVEVTFHDDGCGMSPEVLDHIFEPFYTTKHTGKGTGLGLSISHRIVRDHGGTLEATSEGVGLGSTFRLRLWKAPRNVASPSAAA
jgi:signal transduction histidine kinase